MHELALFAGAGGGILGGHLLGWRTVCAVEINPFCREVLLRRQLDGCLPRFPIWDDVTTFDGIPWRGHIDVISGGFPCQDISCAGKGEGIDGARSGLWFEFARIIGEVRPRFVLVENSPMLTSRGLGVVLGDLAACGYNAGWRVLSAAEVGAPHKRDRLWICANTDLYGCNNNRNTRTPDTTTKQFQTWIKQFQSGNEVRNICSKISNTDGVRVRHEPRGQRWASGSSAVQPCDNGETEQMANADGLRWTGCSKQLLQSEEQDNYQCDWWDTESELGRVADGVAHRVDRLTAIGNGQVPAVARQAWELLK